MYCKPPLPPELWEQIPPQVQAALGVVIEGYKRRLAVSEAEVAALKERLNQNSQTSSRPPSTAGPHVKRKPPQAPAGRKPGAQPGPPAINAPWCRWSRSERSLSVSPRTGGAVGGLSSARIRPPGGSK